MKPNNLVPTPVVNKNGVRTTVHKKPHSTASAITAIPAPVVTESDALSPEDRKAISAVIKGKVKESQAVYEWNAKKWSYGDLGATLRSLSDNSLVALRDFLNPDIKGFLNREDRDGFLFALAQKDEKLSGAAIHEYITFSEDMNVSGVSMRFDLIRALHSYDQLPAMENYAYADEATKTQIVALLSVAGSLNSHDLMKSFFSASTQPANPTGDPVTNESYIPVTTENGVVRITDDNLVSLLMDRPEAAEDITELVIKKGINDGELLREILDSETPAIRDGLL